MDVLPPPSLILRIASWILVESRHTFARPTSVDARGASCIASSRSPKELMAARLRPGAARASRSIEAHAAEQEDLGDDEHHADRDDRTERHHVGEAEAHGVEPVRGVE